MNDTLQNEFRQKRYKLNVIEAKITREWKIRGKSLMKSKYKSNYETVTPLNISHSCEYNDFIDQNNAVKICTSVVPLLLLEKYNHSHKHIVQKLQHFQQKHITCNGTVYPIKQIYRARIFLAWSWWYGAVFFS